MARGFITSDDVIYGAITGSYHHGTYAIDSDVDLRYIKASPFHKFVGLNGLKNTEQITITVDENEEIDGIAIELQSFAKALIKNSPTSVEIAMSALCYGDSELMRDLVIASLDTETYLKSLRNYVTAISKKNDAKSKYHAARLIAHGFEYAAKGRLRYTLTDDEVSAYTDIKAGRKTYELPDDWEDLMVPFHNWNTTNLDKVETLVYDYYIKRLIRR